MGYTTLLRLLVFTVLVGLCNGQLQAQLALFKNQPTASVTRAVNPLSGQPVSSRSIDINHKVQNQLADVAPGTSLVLDLLPGVSYTAILDRCERNDDETNSYVWLGHLSEKPDAEVILSTYNQVTVGNVIIDDREAYTITYNKDGTHQVSTLPPGDGHLCGVTNARAVPPSERMTANESTTTRSRETRADSGNEFDILMVYTPRIREINGGEDAVQALINMIIAYSNQAFINSNLPNIKLVKAGTLEVNYVSAVPEVPGGGDPGLETDLDNLTGGIGALYLAHTVRDEVQADFVHLLAPAYPSGVIGLAWIGGSANYAFGVSTGVVDSFTACDTVAHELGHNYGLVHDFFNGNIMSYDSEKTPRYSASEAQIIQSNAVKMANFRQRQPRQPKLSVDTTAVNIELRQGQRVEIDKALKNYGTSELTFATSDTANWLDVFPPAGIIIDSGARVTTVSLDINTDNVTPGVYTTDVIIDGGAGGSKTIPISLTVSGNTPINDASAFATPISGMNGTLFDSNVNTVYDLSDIPLLNGSFTVWYKWTAPQDGTISFNTEGSSFDTLLGVFVAGGSVGTNDDISATNLQSRVSFNAQQGTEYFIAVGTKLSPLSFGSIRLNWGVNPPPSNDDLLNAQRLTRENGSTACDTFFATDATTDPATIDGEQPHNTVWYQWTPIVPGTAHISTENSHFDTLLGIYTGTPGALLSLAENNDSSSSTRSAVDFTCEEAETYFILVAGKGAAKGKMILEWSFTAAPPAGIAVLPSPLVFQTQAGLDVSPTWLNVQNSSATDFSYAIACDQPWLHVFASEDVTTVPAGQSQPHALYFDNDSMPVGDYSANITITSVGLSTGTITLPVTIKLTPDTVPVPNDMFAKALPVTGLSGIAYTSGKSATVEGHTINGLQDSNLPNSVWLKWQADEYFPPLTEMTFDPDVESGTSPTLLLLASKTQVISAVDPYDVIGNGLKQAWPQKFWAFPEIPYYVYLSGSSGTYQVRWGVGLPLNDNFHDAQTITGLSGNLSVNITNATRQSSEPAKIHGQEASHSVWYKWTAPSNGTLYLDTFGSGFDTLLAVYTGTYKNLTAVAANDDASEANGGESYLSFAYTAGTQYFVRVDGANFKTGTAHLNWSPNSNIDAWQLY